MAKSSAVDSSGGLRHKRAASSSSALLTPLGSRHGRAVSSGMFDLRGESFTRSKQSRERRRERRRERSRWRREWRNSERGSRGSEGVGRSSERSEGVRTKLGFPLWLGARITFSGWGAKWRGAVCELHRAFGARSSNLQRVRSNLRGLFRRYRAEPRASRSDVCPTPRVGRLPFALRARAIQLMVGVRAPEGRRTLVGVRAPEGRRTPPCRSAGSASFHLLRRDRN